MEGAHRATPPGCNGTSLHVDFRRRKISTVALPGQQKNPTEAGRRLPEGHCTSMASTSTASVHAPTDNVADVVGNFLHGLVVENAEQDHLGSSATGERQSSSYHAVSQPRTTGASQPIAVAGEPTPQTFFPPPLHAQASHGRLLQASERWIDEDLELTPPDTPKVQSTHLCPECSRPSATLADNVHAKEW